MSSRLVRSPLGRPVAVEVTTPDWPGLEVGYQQLRVEQNQIDGRRYVYGGTTTDRGSFRHLGQWRQPLSN